MSFSKAVNISAEYMFLAKDEKNLYVEILCTMNQTQIREILNKKSQLIVTPIREAKIRIALQKNDFDPSTLIAAIAPGPPVEVSDTSKV